MLAYTQGNSLWIRDLDQVEPRELLDTQEAWSPFWSPDSKCVGYESGTTLKRVSAQGGPSSTICEIPVRASLAATWGLEGAIVFGTAQEGMFEVPAQGGEPQLLAKPDQEKDNQYLRSPNFLPDGQTLLFLSFKTSDGGQEIVTLSGESRKTVLSMPGNDIRQPTYSPSGHILYSRIGPTPVIWALPFSLASLTPTGDPFPVAEGGRLPSVSSDGTLVYESVGSVASYQLAWADRDGRVEKTIGQPQEAMRRPALSPDGRRVAVTGREGGNADDIWIHDAERGTKTRLTFDPAPDTSPAWSPSGDKVAFNGGRESGAGAVTSLGDIFAKAPDGSGEDQTLVAGPLREGVPDWSPDGKYLIYRLVDPSSNTDWDQWYVPLTGDGKPTPFLQTQFREIESQFSPDSRYVAYMSNESGRFEIYVKPFLSGEGKWQVSVNGGRNPKWSMQSGELFFVEENTLMAVKVRTSPTFEASTPQKLFDGEKIGMRFDTISPTSNMYDVSADGQHFVVVRPVGAGGQTHLTIVENWFAEFRNRQQD